VKEVVPAVRHRPQTKRIAECLGSRKVWDVVAVSFGRITRQAVMVLVMAIAARVLGREFVGVWALIYVVIQFGALLGDSGISLYVVREKELDERGFATALSVSALLALAVGGITVAIGTPLASVLGYSEFSWYFMASGAVVLPMTINSLLQSRLRRDRRFASILIADLAASITILVAFLIMLFRGAELWALIVPTILGAIVGAAICVFFTGLPRPSLDLTRIRSIADYSLGLVGFNSIYYWARNADHVLIGRFLGASSLGVYSVAYRIMMLPLAQINATAHLVALPYLSPYQEDIPRLRNSLQQIIVVIGMLTTLPMICVWLERHLIVELILGPQWSRVADLLMVLAPLAILQALVNPTGLCYQVTGRTKTLFVIGLIQTIVTVCSFIVGVWIGSIEAVVVCYAIINVIVLPLTIGVAMNTISDTFTSWLRCCLPFFGCIAACWIVTKIIPSNSNPWLQALITLFASAMCCLPFYLYAMVRAFPNLHGLSFAYWHKAKPSSSSSVAGPPC
tara:strand:+ start:104430 stop:105959 length:1530 start_codon:yes stop_codon:yes gene_type:complete